MCLFVWRWLSETVNEPTVIMLPPKNPIEWTAIHSRLQLYYSLNNTRNVRINCSQGLNIKKKIVNPDLKISETQTEIGILHSALISEKVTGRSEATFFLTYRLGNHNQRRWSRTFHLTFLNKHKH